MHHPLMKPVHNLFSPRGSRLPRNFTLPSLYRLLEEGRESVVTGEGARDSRLAEVEAVFLVADEPLSLRKLAKAAGLGDAAEARQIIRRLQEIYERDESAFQIEELAGGFQMLTRPRFHRWLVRLRSTAPEMRLTGAAKETLAIVAYRQPIMRADVESIRGVHCGETLRQLMEKGLVRIAGRHDSLGRPVLYGTTRKFLQVFGLKSLKELPEVVDLRPPTA